jgi:hypothetical protein
MRGLHVAGKRGDRTSLRMPAARNVAASILAAQERRSPPAKKIASDVLWLPRFEDRPAKHGAASDSGQIAAAADNAPAAPTGDPIRAAISALPINMDGMATQR